jgi:hypothetical protein
MLGAEIIIELQAIGNERGFFPAVALALAGMSSGGRIGPGLWSRRGLRRPTRPLLDRPNATRRLLDINAILRLVLRRNAVPAINRSVLNRPFCKESR